jgi:hypothetical protein
VSVVNYFVSSNISCNNAFRSGMTHACVLFTSMTLNLSDLGMLHARFGCWLELAVVTLVLMISLYPTRKYWFIPRSFQFIEHDCFFTLFNSKYPRHFVCIINTL